MSFISTYPLTVVVTQLTPALKAVSGESVSGPAVGVYANGLVTILDESMGHTILRAWTGVVGQNCIALFTTAFGDVFYLSRETGAIYFLETQRGTAEFVDNDPLWVIDEFLTTPNIVSQVLRKSLVDTLVARLRPLAYGETFVLEPWLMLGGVEHPENFTIGKFGVYLDLVAQTLTSKRT